MITYKTYLEVQGYSPSSIVSYTNEAQYFTRWSKKHGTSPITIDYKTSLKYIKHLTRKGNSKTSINQKLVSIKHYFNYQIQAAYRTDNPIENLTIKGIKSSTPHHLLDPDELEDLYYSIETAHIQDHYHKHTAKRNKVIVGFIVYQGLGTTTLGHLTLEHLELSKGKIYIPNTRRSNARELELKPWQIMALIEYMSQVRPELQKRIGNHTQQLFPHNTRFSVITYHINKQLKRYNHKVRDLKQLRASVITSWLGQYNLRKVQYMAGHRYISSTERYLQDDLENLHEIVNNYHPIS